MLPCFVVCWFVCVKTGVRKVSRKHLLNLRSAHRDEQKVQSHPLFLKNVLIFCVRVCVSVCVRKLTECLK